MSTKNQAKREVIRLMRHHKRLWVHVVYELELARAALERADTEQARQRAAENLRLQFQEMTSVSEGIKQSLKERLEMERLIAPYPDVWEVAEVSMPLLGGEVLAPPEGEDPPQVVLPAFVAEAINSAQDGNSKSWGLLYGAAAAYTRSGHPLPEPLRMVMADRMQSIANALNSPRETDKQKVLPGAVAPGRKRGRPKDADEKLKTLAKEAVALAGENPTKQSLKAAVEYICKMLPRKPGTNEPLYLPSSILLEAQILLPRKK